VNYQPTDKPTSSKNDSTAEGQLDTAPVKKTFFIKSSETASKGKKKAPKHWVPSVLKALSTHDYDFLMSRTMLERNSGMQLRERRGRGQ
jgi:hypothetical protein